MKANAGRLDRRITVERLSQGAVNGFGEAAETWAVFISVAAMRSDVSDGEKVAAAQRSSALMSRFVIRAGVAARTVTSLDRLVYDGRVWNIAGIKETAQGRDQYLEITAVRESD